MDFVGVEFTSVYSRNAPGSATPTPGPLIEGLHGARDRPSAYHCTRRELSSVQRISPCRQATGGTRAEGSMSSDDTARGTVNLIETEVAAPRATSTYDATTFVRPSGPAATKSRGSPSGPSILASLANAGS